MADGNSSTPKIPQGYGPIHEVMDAEGRAAVATDIVSGNRKVLVADPTLGIWRPFSHPDGLDWWCTRGSDEPSTTGIWSYRQPPSPIYNKVIVIVSLLPTDKSTEERETAKPATPDLQTPKVESARHSGGKEPDHDWEKAARYVDGQAPLPRNKQGEPVTQRAIDLMRDYFKTSEPPPPWDRSIRRWITDNPSRTQKWWGAE